MDSPGRCVEHSPCSIGFGRSAVAVGIEGLRVGQLILWEMQGGVGITSSSLTASFTVRRFGASVLLQVGYPWALDLAWNQAREWAHKETASAHTVIYKHNKSKNS